MNSRDFGLEIRCLPFQLNPNIYFLYKKRFVMNIKIDKKKSFLVKLTIERKKILTGKSSYHITQTT